MDQPSDRPATPRRYHRGTVSGYCGRPSSSFTQLIFSLSQMCSVGANAFYQKTPDCAPVGAKIVVTIVLFVLVLATLKRMLVPGALFGAFAASRLVIPAMKRRGRGAIIFIGATASMRGGARSAGFSSAKAAQRALAQSMARHLWPAGIHVALVVVDGVIDLPRTREQMPGKPDDFFLRPDAIAATVMSIVGQDRSAWSFEVEARPFGETW